MKARDVLAESVVVQLEDSRQIKVKAADLIHIGPPLDDESPRKGCGGGGGTTPPSPSGTPGGTYTITVTGTSGATTHTTTVALTVN